MREIKSHTALRGLASIFVMISHYRTVLDPFLKIDQYTQFFVKSYLWVDCFFLLSGFILYRVYGAKLGAGRSDCRQFLMARIARVYPLHLATLLFLAVYFIVLPKISHQTNHPSWLTFYFNLINIHAWGLLDSYDWNFPSWSISVESAAYLAFPLLCIGLAKLPRLTTSLLLVAFCAALFIGRDHWERTALYHGFPMFCAGVLISYFETDIDQRWLNVIQIASATALIVILHFGLPDALAAFCFGSLIFSIRLDSGPSRLLSAWPFLLLGTWSYSIYMLHIPMQFIFFQFSYAWHPMAIFMCLILSTIIAAAMSFRYFEVPCRTWLRGPSPPSPTQADHYHLMLDQRRT